MKDTFEGKEVQENIRVSRAAEEEFFAIETKMTAPLDEAITNSRVIFSLPNSHPVFEVCWGDDLNVGIGSDGFIGAVIRLKGEWFWEEAQLFDYRIIITTSAGTFVDEGQAVVE